MKKGRTILTVLGIALLLCSIPTRVGSMKHGEGGKSGGIKILVDIMASEEHQKMMKMEMQHKMHQAAHHLSVNLVDEATSEQIKEAAVDIVFLSPEYKVVETKHLMFMSKMGHFGGNITLAKGKFYVKVEATLNGDVKYTVQFPFVVP